MPCAAGAKVCHVDASKGMVSWARENAQLSGLQDRPIRWIVDDCKKFVEREIRRGNRYDGIVMDPPSYGRGPGGEVWKLEDSIYDLVELCAGVLSDDPLFFLLNSYTTGLSPSVMEYILGVTVGNATRARCPPRRSGFRSPRADLFCRAAAPPSGKNKGKAKGSCEKRASLFHLPVVAQKKRRKDMNIL